MRRAGCRAWKWNGGHIAGVVVTVAAIMVLAGCDLLSLIPTFSVTYQGNGNTGGTVPMDAAKYSNGQTITVLGNTGSLVKSGNSFVGWNTESSGSGTDRPAGSTFAMGSGNVILYARWDSESVTMVAVPGGSFQMGVEGIATPVHQVNLTGFRMGKYEVTQAQYQTVTGSIPSYFTSGADAPTRPVEKVTWYDAVEFCNRLSVLDGFTPVYTITGRSPASGYPITGATVTQDMTKNGYRLPTEAEWEYAARGGNGSPGAYTYSGSNDVGTVAWYGSNSGSTTHVVGTKAVNGLGLYDMSGNVWEWCQDWYDSGYYALSPSSDPPGASSDSTRVFRGGSWSSDAGNCRSAFRSFDYPEARHNNVGFRVARRP